MSSFNAVEIVKVHKKCDAISSSSKFTKPERDVNLIEFIQVIKAEESSQTSAKQLLFVVQIAHLWTAGGGSGVGSGSSRTLGFFGALFALLALLSRLPLFAFLSFPALLALLATLLWGAGCDGGSLEINSGWWGGSGIASGWWGGGGISSSRWGRSISLGLSNLGFVGALLALLSLLSLLSLLALLSSLLYSGVLQRPGRH